MKRAWQWVGILALGCPGFALASPASPALDFGPDQFLQAVTVLEQQPTDKSTVASRPLLLSWLEDTPKVTITWNVCAAKLPWAMGSKNADPASVLLFSQDLLEIAAAQIQSPSASPLEQETRAMEGTLRMYERLRTHEGMTNLQAEAIRKAYRANGAKALKVYTCAGTEPLTPQGAPQGKGPLISTTWSAP